MHVQACYGCIYGGIFICIEGCSLHIDVQSICPPYLLWL